MKRALLVLAAATVMIAAGADALAWELYNPYRRWFPASLARPIYVDPRGRSSINDPDRGVTGTLRAIERWEEAQGVGDLVRPVRGTPTDPNGVPVYAGGDGISVLRFDDPATICTGGCLAATSVGYFNLFDSGECGPRSFLRFTDSDVAFNNANYAYTSEEEVQLEGNCSGEYYMEHIALHEVGHLLALAHSASGSAVMYAFANVCEAGKTHPVLDDRDGIRAAYDCDFKIGGVFVDSDADGARADTDCDDQDNDVRPGAVDVCDGKDNDCDGLGDAAEGLACAEICLDAPAGSDSLRVAKGACVDAARPGFRQVFSRGVLASLAGAGVTSVEALACPRPFLYDRLGESSPLTTGQDKYYLVRQEFGTYGAASDGTPRTPAETGCP